MKIVVTTLVVAGLLVSAADAFAGEKCFGSRKVVRVATGYVDGSKGPDSGDAVYFTLDNGAVFPLNTSYNLDHAKGQALHHVLMTAMAGRYYVAGFDHHGTMCDDIDEIWISEIN